MTRDERALAFTFLVLAAVSLLDDADPAITMGCVIACIVIARTSAR